MNWWFFPYGAPRNATEIEALTDRGETIIIHWACDLSGEEKPPYRGWFMPVRDTNGKLLYFREVYQRVEFWRSIRK